MRRAPLAHLPPLVMHRTWVDAKLIIDGKIHWICDHPDLGPWPVGIDGEPELPPEGHDPFWRAVDLWVAQGKRLTPERVCIWSSPPLPS